MSARALPSPKAAVKRPDDALGRRQGGLCGNDRAKNLGDTLAGNIHPGRYPSRPFRQRSGQALAEGAQIGRASEDPAVSETAVAKGLAYLRLGPVDIMAPGREKFFHDGGIKGQP